MHPFSTAEKEAMEAMQKYPDKFFELKSGDIPPELLASLIEKITVVSQEQIEITYAYSDIIKKWCEEAQKAIRVRRKRESYKKEENPSPLKGKVKCGCCGYSMSLRRAVKKRYYYCRMGSGCGSYLKIGLEPLEKTVWGVLCRSWQRHTMKKRRHVRVKRYRYCQQSPK